MYAPAFQSGHPDHDGLYVAAQLARSALGDSTRSAGVATRSTPSTTAGTPDTAGSIRACSPTSPIAPFSADEIERKSRAAPCLHLAGPRGIGRPELARRSGGRAVRADAGARRADSAPPLLLRRDLPLRRARNRPRHRRPRAPRRALERLMTRSTCDALMGIALDEARAAHRARRRPGRRGRRGDRHRRASSLAVTTNASCWPTPPRTPRSWRCATPRSRRGAGGSTATCSWSRSSRARCARAQPWRRAISEVAFGATDPKAGALGTLYNLAADSRLNHQFEVHGGRAGRRVGGAAARVLRRATR